MLESAAILQGDGYGELREAVQVVRGAVQGIDYPLIVIPFAAAAFFGQDAVVGVSIAQYPDDGLFGVAVDLADEVVHAFG